MSYDQFLSTKNKWGGHVGLESIPALNANLKPWQADIVSWALRTGKAALFLDTGLGKTIQQLEWARVIHAVTGGDVLILAPLAVSAQTLREAKKFQIDCPVNVCRDQTQVKPGITITNYEMLAHFDPSKFVGVVLDESSILKNYSGKTKNMICDAFIDTRFKLACTATPAPNDFIELGNHAEFLNAMSRVEMLSMFFVHDGGDTQKWRLKGHAADKFWEWFSSFSVMLSNPRDIGHNGDEYDLPDLNVIQHIVDADHSIPTDGMLFRMPAVTLMERKTERRMTIKGRCQLAATIANQHDGPFLAWCDLNSESAELARMIHGAVEVKGSDSIEHKIKSLSGFSDGSIRCLVTKPSICGFGMNWQHCHSMAFVGLSDSYEQFYQALRRCWRFGQAFPVDAHVIISETEGAVLENIKRKQLAADDMKKSMLRNMSDLTKNNIHPTSRTRTEYQADQPLAMPEWMG